VWLRRRERLLRAEEKMALQGVMHPEYSLQRGDVEVSSAEVDFLTGNAFNAACLLLPVVGLFTHVHWLWGR
jgi:hypothetical protein|tara:strand:- start:68 stop:280 length:213 start_codon:yes stop_codon:yes gene_type:complete